jgi:hypothetical protein
MAMFDWTPSAQANVFTAAASRKRLAARTAKLIKWPTSEKWPIETKRLIFSDS